MKKAFTILIFVIFLAHSWNSSAISKTITEEQREVFYSTYIDQLVIECKNKVEWRIKAKLKNVRNEAALLCFKAHYFEKFKEELIEEMITANMGVKKHRIDYYLNKKFFEMLESAVLGVPHLKPNGATFLYRSNKEEHSSNPK